MHRARLVIGIVIAIVLIVGGGFVASRQNLRFDVPYPEVTGSSGSAVVERGRYLVRGLAPCALATAIRLSGWRSSTPRMCP